MQNLTEPVTPRAGTTPSGYANEVAGAVFAAFNDVALHAPHILHPEASDEDAEGPEIKLGLQSVIPVTNKEACVTIVASGLKWPISYIFRAQALGDQRVHVSPVDQNFIMPHSQQPEGANGYCLDDPAGTYEPEIFANEIVGNYIADHDRLSWNPPVQRTVDAQEATFVIN